MTTPPWLKIVFKIEQRHLGVFRDLVTLGTCVCRSGQREDESRRTAAEFKPEEPSGRCEASAASIPLKPADPFLDLFSAASMERLSQHTLSSVARETRWSSRRGSPGTFNGNPWRDGFRSITVRQPGEVDLPK